MMAKTNESVGRVFLAVFKKNQHTAAIVLLGVAKKVAKFVVHFLVFFLKEQPIKRKVAPGQPHEVIDHYQNLHHEQVYRGVCRGE